MFSSVSFTTAPSLENVTSLPESTTFATEIRFVQRLGTGKAFFSVTVSLALFTVAIRMSLLLFAFVELLSANFKSPCVFLTLENAFGSLHR